MEKLLELLIEILDEIISCMENLCGISREKTNMVACSNIEGINDIVEKEHEIKLAMDTAEKKRIGVVSEIAAFLNISGNVNASDIIANSEEPFKSQLVEKHSVLKNLVKEFKEINSLNTDLIKSHLNFIDYMVNVMTGQKLEAPTYGVNGYTQSGENKKMYDYKA